MCDSGQIAHGDDGPIFFGPNLLLAVQDFDLERTALGAVIILAHRASHDADGSRPEAPSKCGRRLRSSTPAASRGRRARRRRLPSSLRLRRVDSAFRRNRRPGSWPAAPTSSGAKLAIVGGRFGAPAVATRLGKVAAERRERQRLAGRRFGHGPAACVAVAIDRPHGILMSGCPSPRHDRSSSCRWRPCRGSCPSRRTS